MTFSEVIEVADVDWIRLYFSHANLGRVAGREDATILRITSLEDGAVQELTATTLEQWRRSSAFFNGDAVRVELLADPDAPASRVKITEVMVAEASLPLSKSICGATDDRTLLNDPRAGRIVPVGCSAWLIDDAEGCFLTAGHCTGDNFDVVEFNVPLSDANGAINHPGPQDQYPIDLASLQWDQTVIGNDWAYFGAFPNGQTEMTAIEAQGASYVLGVPPVAPGGEMIRITGYGSTSGTQGVPLDWNQVGTTHVGPLTIVNGSRIQYATDTTGGNSGSAVLVEGTNEAIGIHTNAGCSAGGGSNSGTSLANAAALNALANPVGVCVDGAPPLRIDLFSALPNPVPLAGSTFQIAIVDRTGTNATINGATLVYNAGGGDQSVPLVPVSPEGEGAIWEATLPSMACGSEVTFRVDVEATNGTTVRHPFSPQNSVDRRYLRRAANSFDQTFGDDFETNMGWTVDDDVALTAGSWARGTPAGYGMSNDPPWDADSSGALFATELAGGNTDIDGGATRLISPTLDATGTDPHFSYWRWWSDGGASDDSFTVEVSDDDGGSWTVVETVGPNLVGSWVRQTLRVADFVTPNNQFKIRFTASDLGAGNIIEAAVDGVALFNTASGVVCGTPLFSDGFESGDTSAWDTSTP